MLIPDGTHILAPGKIASVVTYLQMTGRPTWIDGKYPGELEAMDVSSLDTYRAMFRRVGENWMWFSRLRATDEQLTERLTGPGYAVYLYDGGSGLVEMHHQASGDVEIVLFGLTPPETGRGQGRAMMAHALRLAWSTKINRVWLHTCTLDDPKALAFYRKMGFRPYARGIEIAGDPRLDGYLPVTAAPQMPLIPK
jgi:GNAT superfamily N-acetyltransferase